MADGAAADESQLCVTGGGEGKQAFCPPKLPPLGILHTGFSGIGTGRSRGGRAEGSRGRALPFFCPPFCPPGSFIFRRAANRRRGFWVRGSLRMDSMVAEIIAWDRNRGSSHHRVFF